MTVDQHLQEELHQALESLNDNVFLARAALVGRFPAIAELPNLDLRAEQMRAILLQAIEALRPPHRFGFGSFESRFYDVLSLRYVENRTVRLMMQELHLGRRQVYRDLAQAEERLALAIADGFEAGASATLEGSPGQEQASGVLALELARLAQTPAEVDLVEIARETVSLLGSLAENRQIQLECSMLPRRLMVLGDRVVVKQTLVHLLSCVLQSARGSVFMRLAQREDEGVLRLTYTAGEPPLMARLADAECIAATQGGRCEFSLSDPSCCRITLTLPRGRPASVLVVEDNADTVALYRRYLAGREWQLQVVSDPNQALEAAVLGRPQVIVLDVMMPGMDGWSLLQALRANPVTACIPVLVCSVVDDPELAVALGGSAYIKKPILQERLLSSLRRLLS